MNNSLKFIKCIIFILFIHTELNACTIFTSSKGGAILAGNNEDWYETNPFVWFVPANYPGSFGRMYFGNDRWAYFGGMNEQGLFFDVASLPARENIVFPSDKNFYYGNLREKMMAECSTVGEAIKLFQTYNYEGLKYNHIFIADKTGDAAVIEWGINDLSIIRKNGDQLIATNFNLTNHTGGDIYPCWRYNRVKLILDSCQYASVDLFKNILQQVHAEGDNPTIYSNIYDLKAGNVYTYFMHNYDKLIFFNIHEELAKGNHKVYLNKIISDQHEPEFLAPVRAKLYQNYPNPFNPSTTITYSIPSENFVTIRICNIIGDEIAALVNEEKSPGIHTVDFNAGNLSSGVYFCRIQTGSFTDTKKIILMK